LIANSSREIEFAASPLPPRRAGGVFLTVATPGERTKQVPVTLAEYAAVSVMQIYAEFLQFMPPPSTSTIAIVIITHLQHVL